MWIECHQNRRYLNFQGGGGKKPTIRGGYVWPAMPIFELGWAIPVKSHVWKFGLDWLSLSRVIIWIFQGEGPPISGVTCDLRCPFLDLAELFQSKVMCENLVQIGWAFQEISCPQTFFRGQKPSIRGGLHLTCDAHFRIQMSYSCQKSCVKIWFGLVEIGGMLILRGVTCDLWCPFSNLAELF